MRSIFIAIFVITYWGTCSYGQSKEVIITNIRNEFQKINNDKSLKIVEIKNDDMPGPITDNGKSLTGFYKSDTICKIKAWIGLSYGIRQYEYYLKNNRLFFVYETEQYFSYDNVKNVIDYRSLTPGYECRYYLYAGRIIDVKKKGQRRFEDKSVVSYQGLASDVKAYTKILISHLKKM